MNLKLAPLALAALVWGCDAKASSQAQTPPASAAPSWMQEASTALTVKIDDV
jgi:hypothetical protein